MNRFFYINGIKYFKLYNKEYRKTTVFIKGEGTPYIIIKENTLDDVLQVLNGLKRKAIEREMELGLPKPLFNF